MTDAGDISVNGTFSWSEGSTSLGCGIYTTNDGRVKATIDFNANRVVPTTTENRPYSIHALPLIAY